MVRNYKKKKTSPSLVFCAFNTSVSQRTCKAVEQIIIELYRPTAKMLYESSRDYWPLLKLFNRAFAKIETISHY